MITAGVDVIVDDVGWIGEPFFEDGTIASHVESVLTAQNIIYVSAAGNSANSHYQGDYFNDGFDFHDFSRSVATNDYLYASVPNNGNITVVLQWNDSFGESSNDYDLYLYNLDNWEILDGSTITQNGDDDPLEYISYTNNTGSSLNVEIDINNYLDQASPKTLEVFIYTSGGAANYTNNIVATDSIFGHPAVPGVIAVGAIDANDTNHDTIQHYSSQGPVTITGSSQRNKPDITGIDGVSITGAGGFSNPFFGTSAAAPHVAAIAAQLWGAYPLAIGNQIKNHLLTYSVDLGMIGQDYVFGYGRANALLAFQAAPETPVASISEGNHYSSVYVELTSSNSTSIRYTTDGSTPTCASNLYSTPILVSATTTIKAVGCGVFQSAVMSKTYTINEPASTWYLAEGYTGSSFKTYVLLQNPNEISATVNVTYMIQGEDNVSKQYTVGANTRYTIAVNSEIGSGKSVSTQVSADQNIIVERAMYWDGGGTHWVGGHNTTGVD